MSLKTTIQNAAKTAFGVVSSMLESVTIKHKTGTSYDSGTMVNTPTYSSTTTQAIVANFNAREIDNSSILASDKRIVIERRLVANIDPADRITLGASTDEYDIMSVKEDPAEAVWVLQVRR